MKQQPIVLQLSKTDLLSRRPPPKFCRCEKSQTTVERTGVLRCEHCGRPIKSEQ